MMALSKRNDEPERASRPWDKGRDGFVLGEGAAVLVLESEEHAKARGARVYAEVAGAGITADSPRHRPARPRRSAAPPGRCRSRCARPASTPSDIVHVNAHATSTPQGDVAEAGAIRHAPSATRVDGVVVTSTKSMTGHLLGAAGALESVATVLASAEPDRAADHQPRRPRGRRPRHRRPSRATCRRGDLAALNNSFGFGGHNVALAFKSV